MNILILQKNTNKAGAQHALFRILSSAEFRKHDIVVICSTEGWLTHKLQELDVTNIIKKYPSIKSITGKLFRIYNWTNKISKKLKSIQFYPDIILSNNHIEFPYALKIQKKFNKSKTMIYFRDSYIKKHDFKKFQCEKANIKITVSQSMKDMLNYCNDLIIIQDGLLEKEFYPTIAKKIFSPKQILLVGAPTFIKGWDIFFQVIKNIYRDNNIIISEKIVCTGIPNKEQFNKYNLTTHEIKKFNIVFSKKFENLAYEARKYDLAIFPSRKESFGLSQLEIIAAGVPLLSSKTGIIEDVIKQADFLFEVDSTKSLETKILNLYNNWKDINFNFEQSQNYIKLHNLIQIEIQKLLSLCLKEIDEKNSLPSR